MSNWEKLFPALNVFVYRVSNGHLGNRLGKQSVLLLHTLGRRSGKQRITSLSYYRDGSRYILVASNWGKESHPAWFYNLMHQPRAKIQVGPRTYTVDAHQALGEEYDHLWQLVTRQNAQYFSYQEGLKRRIPILILTPAEDEGEK